MFWKENQCGYNLLKWVSCIGWAFTGIWLVSLQDNRYTQEQWSSMLKQKSGILQWQAKNVKVSGKPKTKWNHCTTIHSQCQHHYVCTWGLTKQNKGYPNTITALLCQLMWYWMATKWQMGDYLYSWIPTKGWYQVMDIMELDSVRICHATQFDAQFKIHKLLVFGIFCLIFSDYSQSSIIDFLAKSTAMDQGLLK